MTKYHNILLTILSGSADSNILFKDIRNLLLKLGFQERIKGSHHIFYRQGVKEIINLQPKGKKAKPYQVKQVRNLILDYKLGESDVD
jgi:predicted RNA binding protein YcfA (HicA-like mRNA interferase family)